MTAVGLLGGTELASFKAQRTSIVDDVLKRMRQVVACC